ncbi:hypothetical protein H257_09532 [Aphanomyces astaci]|uniref:Uncharacterized protein n=1 Tax=Aphanomyces astaci TaxID=112090 RepID=W4GBT0_APHAT|nr:hypothetical protein H257_09532 [Aphanomyces astaci]ETV76529.1 hypothetical protein H257_09532 [Aphanomyces astaci]|eukprot:XP_009834075.1 hypothetical protein H257_09532 [Aphanomyces astaci]
MYGWDDTFLEFGHFMVQRWLLTRFDFGQHSVAILAPLNRKPTWLFGGVRRSVAQHKAQQPNVVVLVRQCIPETLTKCIDRHLVLLQQRVQISSALASVGHEEAG